MCYSLASGFFKSSPGDSKVQQSSAPLVYLVTKLVDDYSKLTTLTCAHCCFQGLADSVPLYSHSTRTSECQAVPAAWPSRKAMELAKPGPGADRPLSK